MEKNSLPIFIQLFCLVKQLNENDAVFFWVKGIHKTKTGLHSPAHKLLLAIFFILMMGVSMPSPCRTKLKGGFASG